MPKAQSYPTLRWNANNKRLIHELFNVLDDAPSIRKGLWPRRGESVSGGAKVIHRKNLARKLLESDPVFAVHVNNPIGLSHFEKAIKSQIWRLEKSWKKAKDTLGVTGAGLPDEDAIGNEGPVRDKWEEVKDICPWFFRMRDMVEDRFDDFGAAITNSETDAILDATQRGDRRRHHQDTDMETDRVDMDRKSLGNGGNDDDDHNDAAEKDGYECHVINPTPTTAAKRLLFKSSTPTASGSAPSQSALSPSNPKSCSRRKSTALSELTEAWRHNSVMKNKRKRLRHIEIEETKRLESKEITRRLESQQAADARRQVAEDRRQEAEDRRQERKERMAMRRLALEERRIALEEVQLRDGVSESWQPIGHMTVYRSISDRQVVTKQIYRPIHRQVNR
ncbi:hypothetical protein MMC07_008329 [Pseudocyphellaria aurata]|nr:hypothetical protein [Pseudocyphellaria aurata]